MTKDEFTGRLIEIGFTRDQHAFAWRREADDAVMSVEFIDDLLAYWPNLAPEALKLWTDGATALKVVSEERDGKLVGRLEVVE